MSADANESELWMVPYADLMSTLVILFLALYGFAAMKQEEEKKKEALKPKETVEARVVEQERVMAAELEKTVVERLPKGAATVRLDAERLQLTLASPLLFESGSAELSEGIRPFLDKLAEALKALPNEVQVEGHTDAAPIRGGKYPSNWDLSAARAYSVVAYLSKQGLPASRFSIFGYGEHRPVDTNATEEGRSHNRRIEISLLRRTGS